MNDDFSAYRVLLLAMKEELCAKSERGSDALKVVELDQTRQGRLSRQDALMQQEMAKAAERKRQMDILLIEKALVRIENGDYGYCTMCEEPIAQKRLQSSPFVALCIHCAK